MRGRWLAVALLALTGSARAAPPLAAFGHLPSVDLIALSPDGSKFAVAVGDEERRQIQVRSVSDQTLIQNIGTGRNKIRSLLWAGEHHVLITASQTAKLGGLSGPKREYYLVTDFNLTTHRMDTLLSHGIGDVGKLNAVFGTPQTMVLDARCLRRGPDLSWHEGSGHRLPRRSRQRQNPHRLDG